MRTWLEQQPAMPVIGFLSGELLTGSDPVDDGTVESLSRPGGNATEAALRCVLG